MIKINALRKSEFEDLQRMMPEVIVKFLVSDSTGLTDVVVYDKYLEIKYEVTSETRGYLSLTLTSHEERTEKIISFCNEDFYKVEII